VSANNFYGTGLYVNTIGATGGTGTINLTSNISSSSNITTTGYMVGNCNMQTFSCNSNVDITTSTSTPTWTRIQWNNNTSNTKTALTQGTGFVTLNTVSGNANIYSFSVSESGTYLINCSIDILCNTSDRNRVYMVILKNQPQTLTSVYQGNLFLDTYIGYGLNAITIRVPSDRVGLSSSAIMPLDPTANVAVYIASDGATGVSTITYNSLGRSMIQFVRL
jgi:hypothetical protein